MNLISEQRVDELGNSLVGNVAKEKFLSFFSDCYYPADKITVTGRLGSGTYARVFKATLNDTTQTKCVAIKKMDPSLFREEADVLDFFRETKLLASARKASHPNILAFIGVTFGAMEDGSEESMCIIEECINFGTLKSHIERTRSHEEKISVKTFLELMLHVARGLSFLHFSEVSVIHRDLKPANILIDRDEKTGKLTAKIVDFGLSVLVYDSNPRGRTASTSAQKRDVFERPKMNKRTLVRSLSGLKEYADAFVLSRRASRLRGRGSSNFQKRSGSTELEFYSLTGQTGSLAYMAPEVYDGCDYNHKADVFSFGVLAFEALDLVHPFIYYIIEKKLIGMMGNDAAAMEDYARATAEGYRPKFGNKWPPSLASVISDCWAARPEDRPNMDDVVKRLEEIYSQCQTENVFLSSKWKLCGCLSA